MLPEQAGGDADVAAEAVDEVFLAVVAGGIGDLLDRELGRGKQVLRLVDAAEDDVFIGRIAGFGLELARKVRRAQRDRGGDLLHAQLLEQVAVHVADGLCDAVAAGVSRRGVVEQQQAEYAVEHLRELCLAGALVCGAAGEDAVEQLRDLADARGHKDLPAAVRLKDAAVKRARVQSVEQQPREFEAVRGGVAVGLAAVEQHDLSGGGERSDAAERQLHRAAVDIEQHDVLVVIALHGDLRAVVERIQAAAKVMTAARGVIKKLACKRGRGEEISFRGLMHAFLRDQHKASRSFAAS